MEDKLKQMWIFSPCIDRYRIEVGDMFKVGSFVVFQKDKSGDMKNRALPGSVLSILAINTAYQPLHWDVWIEYPEGFPVVACLPFNMLRESDLENLRHVISLYNDLEMV